MFELIITLAALLLTYLGVGALRTWAERHQILDEPNERSSHEMPTPRGGGLAIVVVVLLGAWLAYLVLAPPDLPWSVLLAFTLGAVLIAAVSWVDDLRSLPTYTRFIAHSVGAVLVIAAAGYWSTVAFAGLGPVYIGLLGLPITFLWIVGLTNAYNFMDGIDGIAGGQALVAGLGYALLGWYVGLQMLGVLGLLLAASSLGFLFYNWSPARIFMGDVGSAFLGFTFACLAVIAAQANPVFVFAGVLLVWPFVFDAGFTFACRAWRRENVLSPHRSHLYQRLIISGLSHRQVSSLYIGLDLLGLILAFVSIAAWPTGGAVSALLLVICCVALWRGTIWQEKRCA